jgi:hypothetical protein
MAVTRLTTNGLTGTKYDIASADNYYMEPIATTLLGSAAGSITFSNIPQGYKHLQIRGIGLYSSTVTSALFRFNGDTGSNYSETPLRGDGSAATSGPAANRTFTWTCLQSAANTQFNTISNFMNYADATTNTSVLSRANSNSSGDYVAITAGLWRNTAAINSITVLTLSASNFNVGSTFTLYGIKAGS